jgi:hypothetical protein
MVVTMARKKGIGIIVTGSHQEETGIFTACEQDLRKPNCLIRPHIHGLQRDRRTCPVAAQRTKAEAQSAKRPPIQRQTGASALGA